MATKKKTKPIGKAGITTDPWRRKGGCYYRYPNLTNWHEAGPFRGVEPAIEWEKEQAKLGYETTNGGDDPGFPEATRYGYRFDYGPEPRKKTA